MTQAADIQSPLAPAAPSATASADADTVTLTRAEFKAILDSVPPKVEKANRYARILDITAAVLVMKEYTAPGSQEAQRLQAEAQDNRTKAAATGDIANRYVLLTVLFASVLFFGGITGKFQFLWLDAAMLAAAVLLFLAGITMLVRFPIN